MRIRRMQIEIERRLAPVARGAHGSRERWVRWSAALVFASAAALALVLIRRPVEKPQPAGGARLRRRRAGRRRAHRRRPADRGRDPPRDRQPPGAGRGPRRSEAGSQRAGAALRPRAAGAGGDARGDRAAARQRAGRRRSRASRAGRDVRGDHRRAARRGARNPFLRRRRARKILGARRRGARRGHARERRASLRVDRRDAGVAAAAGGCELSATPSEAPSPPPDESARAVRAAQPTRVARGVLRDAAPLRIDRARRAREYARGRSGSGAATAGRGRRPAARGAREPDVQARRASPRARTSSATCAPRRLRGPGASTPRSPPTAVSVAARSRRSCGRTRSMPRPSSKRGDGHAARARADYQRALAAAPRGALAGESMLGAMDSAEALGEHVAAASLARRYLAGFPAGLGAARARRIAGARRP